jgi:RND family efflux transporter MFP subunit
VLLAVLPLASGCKPEAKVSAEQPVPKVTVTAVVSQETIDSDEYTGWTEASETVEVRARVFGYLKTIDFKDGDFVTEGQKLFTIEPDEYDAIHQQSVSRIAVSTARLELAKSKYERNAKLVKTGAVSQEDYEESVAAVHESEASITAAKADANRTALDLKYTEIKAPIAGRMDRALVTKGNLLTGGQTSGTLLTKIVQERPMYVYFDVDERSLLGYMRRGGSRSGSDPKHLSDLNIPCYVQLADEEDFSHEGKLDFAASEFQTSTGTARLRGVFANQDRTLASGMFVRVRVPVSEPYQASLIPEEALATDQNIKFVYVVGSDGTAERRSVVLGKQRGTMRIITSGLKPGERVIVTGLQRVRPGQKVEAELAKAAAPAAPDEKPAPEKKSPEKKSAVESKSGEAPAKSTSVETPTESKSDRTATESKSGEAATKAKSTGTETESKSGESSSKSQAGEAKTKSK